MSASMSTAPAPTSMEPTFPVMKTGGIRPLPLLTLINYFNYLDRQVVYGMSPLIGDSFGLSKFQLGWLAAVNLVVFSFASLISGPITDRLGPRKVIFTGILVWAAATIGSALSGSFAALLICRAFVGVGEGAYGPSANAVLCANAPPSRRARAPPRLAGRVLDRGRALGHAGSRVCVHRRPPAHRARATAASQGLSAL